jgi:class 3 adenylate cyclase/tetratricopeptide (TPR) repeat protein
VVECPSCRRANADTARFCVACGTALVLACAECGADVPAGATFCPSCGAPVAVEAKPSGDERKVVTVLFADLVGSTSRAERLDPEDVRGLLSPYFASVRGEVERFGGTIEKFIGDAVVAIFGAPVAHEDDPERAVRTAFAMREAVGELNDGSDVDLHLRIGVNTGEAVVSLGAIETGVGIVTGDVVNTCQRLETAAPVDGILVGESTYRATAGAFEYREAGPVPAKGKSRPVPAWEALSAREAAERPATPLVGRWQELSQLLDALVRVREERTPQLVSLVGVPGIGKTRLARELVNAVDLEPAFGEWLSGRCLPYGDGVSFAALAEMARSEAGILSNDSAEEAVAKLHAAVASLPGQIDAAWLESHLRPLVGLGADPVERREESFAAWRRYFEALAERQPLLLVFEDLHWADPAVLDFVDYLVDWASGVPLLVLCTARPELLERRPGWGGGKRNAITISLAPLSNDETGELVSALLGRGELPAEIAGPLLARSGGNPLYAEEYVRMLVERGSLVEQNGAWRLAAPDLPLPETVQGTIAARVDGLPPDEKLLLQEAAVVGKVFWLGAVAEALGSEHAEAERELHALERKEFVRRDRRTSIAGEAQYVFRHVLVRDVAYGQIPRARRADAHRQCAEWLEELPGGRDDQAELVAHQYRSALELARASGSETEELVERTRRAAREAGDRALAVHAFSAAARLYEEALELWPADGVDRARLRFAYGKALVEAEGAGADVLAGASRELFEAGERELAAEAEAFQAVLFERKGATEAASKHVQRAAELVEDAAPSQSKAQVLAKLAGLLMTTDPVQAVRLGEEALAMAGQLGLDELRAHALATMGFSKATIGYEGGTGDLEQAIAIGDTVRSPESIRSRSLLAAVLAHQGDLRRSSKLRAKAWSDAERFGNPFVIRFLKCESVFDSYWAGRWEEALAVADAFIAEAARGMRHYGEILCHQIRAEIRLAAGELPGALKDAALSLESARQTGHPQSLYPALATEARALLDSGQTQQAEQLVDELLALWTDEPKLPASFWLADLVVVLEGLGRARDIEALAARAGAPTRWLDAAVAFVPEPQSAARIYAEIGSRPDEAFARLRAAELLVAAGELEQAADELARALDFYRSVGATAFAERADRALTAASGRERPARA